jgi:hypothetical protein
MKHLVIIAILLFAATVYSDEHVRECLNSKDACVRSCSGSTKCIKSCLSAYESCIRGGKGQQPQENECDYDSFYTSRYMDAANKRDIVMKCGQPHHAERQQVVSGGQVVGDQVVGGAVITIGEKWYYYFEDRIFIFTFNNKGELRKKNWKYR